MTANTSFERRLWIGVLAAPLAWVAAEGVGYVSSARLCEAPVGVLRSAEQARVVNVIICSICLLVALVGLAVAIDNYRRMRTAGANVPFGRAEFLAVGGVFASAVFASAIILFAIPAMVVNVCNHVR